MNFQEKLFEATADLRARAATFANAALVTARTRASRRIGVLKGSFDALSSASRQLNKVARTHATRFVKQNATIAAGARRDMSALARSTYATLAKPAAGKRASAAPRARKVRATRKRTTKAA